MAIRCELCLVKIQLISPSEYCLVVHEANLHNVLYRMPQYLSILQSLLNILQIPSLTEELNENVDVFIVCICIRVIILSGRKKFF